MNKPGRQAKYALAMLQKLEDLNVAFAVTHDIPKLLEDSVISDLDLFISSKPSEVVWKLINQAPLDMKLVMLSPYSFGSLATFWMNSDGQSVQLDFTCDPKARGILGIDTTAFLIDRRRRNGIWSLSQPLSQLYLARKRYVKSEFSDAKLYLKNFENTKSNASLSRYVNLRAKLSLLVLSRNRGVRLNKFISKLSYGPTSIYTRALRLLMPVSVDAKVGERDQKELSILKGNLEAAGLKVIYQSGGAKFQNCKARDQFAPVIFLLLDQSLDKPLNSSDLLDSFQKNAVSKVSFYSRFGW